MRALSLTRVPEPVMAVWRGLAHAAVTWLVGGAVRDLALGLAPVDFDLATAMPPDGVMRWAEQAGLAVVRDGLAYGRVGLRMASGRVDVTTFRREGVYPDRRHPASVAWTADGIADLGRRDFTVNAMAVPLDGGIIDPWDGLADLERRCWRAVGDAEVRLAEDALRVLRAVRFLAYAPGDWRWAADLGAALRRQAASALSLSPDRQSAEWRAILLHPFPQRAVAAGADLGLWPPWPAGMPDLGRLPTPGERVALLRALGWRPGIMKVRWPRSWEGEAARLLSGLSRGRAPRELALPAARLASVLGRPWRPAPVSAEELMRALELAPGPLVGILQRRLDQWAAALAQPPSTAEAVRQARRLLASLPAPPARR